MPAVVRRRLPARADQPPRARQTRPRRGTQILSHRENHEGAFTLTVGREVPDASADRLHRALRSGGIRANPASARAQLPGPERHLGHLGSAGADLSVEPHHLASADRQIEARERRPRSGRFEPQQDIADVTIGGGRPTDCPDLLPDHGRHEVVATVFGHGAFEHRGAVPQDLNAIGDPNHLVESVGDVDDRDALVAKALHEGKEALDFLVRKRGSRLVQDQTTSLADERTRDLDDLPLGHTETRDG